MNEFRDRDQNVIDTGDEIRNPSSFYGFRRVAQRRREPKVRPHPIPPETCNDDATFVRMEMIEAAFENGILRPTRRLACGQGNASASLSFGVQIRRVGTSVAVDE